MARSKLIWQQKELDEIRLKGLTYNAQYEFIEPRLEPRINNFSVVLKSMDLRARCHV